MTNFTQLLNDGSVVAFMLLFIRVGTLFVFFPFFNSPTFFPTIKVAIAFMFAIILFGLARPISFELNIANVIVAILAEIMLGMAIGLVLQAVVAAMQYAGELVSFVMGFSMATAYDPQSGSSSPILSGFLNLFSVMLILATDAHHAMIAFMARSVMAIDLGRFVFDNHYIAYMIDAGATIFVVGFTIAFPILGISFLADVIFGMIMKTMPSFNLLVIGFPIKIAIALGIFASIFVSIALVFGNKLKAALSFMSSLV